MNSLTKLFLAVFALGLISLPGYADTVTKTTTTVTTTIREDAPIYMGPVTETELQELTLLDFQQFGNKPSEAFTLFGQYQQELKESKPNPTMVLYKLKITNRDLVLADFEGPNVTPNLAQARYQEYLRINPIPIDGQNVRYVYVYHTPITRPV